MYPFIPFHTNRYVALVATNTKNEKNVHIDGFHVIHLPTESKKHSHMTISIISHLSKCSHSLFMSFTANVSALDTVLTEIPAPRPTQVELMEKMCKRLRFIYLSECFTNPSLASFHSNLEALVYEEEVAEIDDVTVPRCEEQDEKIEAVLYDIDEEFGTVSVYSLNINPKNINFF